jgi:hypothetical protein
LGPSHLRQGACRVAGSVALASIAPRRCSDLECLRDGP